MSTIGGRGAQPSDAGLMLQPFRALHYEPAAVGDLADVAAPPYDVIDDETVSALESRHRYNVVRLIRPHAQRPAQAYTRAAATLRGWISSGVLVEEQQAALYVYEQRTTTTVQRGIVGAIGLRSPRQRVILPHEDVMPEPIIDRLELMRATEANLEPILLAIDGGAGTDALVQHTVTTTPMLELCLEGARHRVWAMARRSQWEHVAADLHGRSALIADGHHRYATYRRLQAERHASGAGPGPWDFGLALLVDTSRYPLQVDAIHRAISGLDVATAAALADSAMTVRQVRWDLDEGMARLATAGRHSTALLAVDDRAMVLLSDPDPAVLKACMPPDSPESWRRIDAAIAHHVLIDGLWGLQDEPQRVTYHHDLASTLRAARRGRGLALLLNPASVDLVTRLAVQGERMPRKSTSFHPKPLTGLLMRLLHESLAGSSWLAGAPEAR